MSTASQALGARHRALFPIPGQLAEPGSISGQLRLLRRLTASKLGTPGARLYLGHAGKCSDAA